MGEDCVTAAVSVATLVPFHALHHQIVDAVLASHVVQRADVRMVQTGDGLGFAFEALLADRIR